MAFENPFYHGAIRSLVVAFGNYFSKMTFVRKKDHSVDGTPMQVIKVPIALSNRDKWFNLLLDANREKQVKITFPRMAFEITGFSYDANRKKARNQEITCIDENGVVQSVGTPSPWNVELALYVVSKNQEDCLQIIEQILPAFNPDINFKIKNVMGIATDIPVSINSVSVQDDYQGAYTDDRLVVYTLGFTAKMELFGEIASSSNGGIVENVGISTPQEDISVGKDGYDVKEKDLVLGSIYFDEGVAIKNNLAKSPTVVVSEYYPPYFGKGKNPINQKDYF